MRRKWGRCGIGGAITWVPSHRGGRDALRRASGVPRRSVSFASFPYLLFYPSLSNPLPPGSLLARHHLWPRTDRALLSASSLDPAASPTGHVFFGCTDGFLPSHPGPFTASTPSPYRCAPAASAPSCGGSLYDKHRIVRFTEDSPVHNAASTVRVSRQRPRVRAGSSLARYEGYTTCSTNSSSRKTHRSASMRPVSAYRA